MVHKSVKNNSVKKELNSIRNYQTDLKNLIYTGLKKFSHQYKLSYTYIYISVNCKKKWLYV